jgi:hypothetical protein
VLDDMRGPHPMGDPCSNPRGWCITVPLAARPPRSAMTAPNEIQRRIGSLVRVRRCDMIGIAGQDQQL